MSRWTHSAPSTADALITATSLTLSYGDRPVFSDISFTVARGAKLALVGDNGAGKSSLLKVLRGIEPSDAGSVELSRSARLTYVEQEPTLPPGSTADEFIYKSDSPAVAALAEYRALGAPARSPSCTCRQFWDAKLNAHAFDCHAG